MVKTTQKQPMPNTIKNILLSAKYPDDREVIGLINEHARTMPGIKPKDALKNFLLRRLPLEIAKLREAEAKLNTEVQNAII